MFRKALINRIQNQITELQIKEWQNDGRGRNKITEGIKRKYSLLYFLVNLKADKVDIKKLENKFRTKLSG